MWLLISRRLTNDEAARDKMCHDLNEVRRMLHAGRSATETAIDRVACITMESAKHLRRDAVPAKHEWHDAEAHETNYGEH